MRDRDGLARRPRGLRLVLLQFYLGLLYGEYVCGEPTDTTVLYLVTRGHGLADALLPMISPVDAATNLPGGQGADNAE